MEDKLRLLEYKDLLLRYYNEQVELGSLGKDEVELDGVESWNDQRVFDRIQGVMTVNGQGKGGVREKRKGSVGNEEVWLLKEENFVLREINKQLKSMLEEVKGNGFGGARRGEFNERSELNVFNLEFRNIPKYPQAQKTGEVGGNKKVFESEEISKKFSQTIKSVKFEFVNRKANKGDYSRSSKAGKSNTNSIASSPEKHSHCRSNSNLI